MFPVFILKLTCNQNYTRNQSRIQGGGWGSNPLEIISLKVKLNYTPIITKYFFNLYCYIL